MSHTSCRRLQCSILRPPPPTLPSCLSFHMEKNQVVEAIIAKSVSAGNVHWGRSRREAQRKAYCILGSPLCAGWPNNWRGTEYASEQSLFCSTLRHTSFSAPIATDCFATKQKNPVEARIFISWVFLLSGKTIVGGGGGGGEGKHRVVLTTASLLQEVWIGQLLVASQRQKGLWAGLNEAGEERGSTWYRYKKEG